MQLFLNVLVFNTLFSAHGKKRKMEEGENERWPWENPGGHFLQREGLAAVGGCATTAIRPCP